METTGRATGDDGREVRFERGPLPGRAPGRLWVYARLPARWRDGVAGGDGC